MLSVYPVEHIADLLLGKSFCIKDAGKPVTFSLLVSQDGEYPRMEVSVSVARNAKLQFAPLAIGGTGTIAVPLITRTIRQKFTAFGDHHTLKHNLHQVMKTIFPLRVLAHLL